MHDGDLEQCLIKEKKIDVYMFLFPFICSGIPGLATGILKMLIRVCFPDALQPALQLLICSWHDMTLSQFLQQMYGIYSKFLLFTSISYVQESFKLKEVNHG